MESVEHHVADDPIFEADDRLTQALASFARLLVADYEVGDVTGTTGAGVLLEDVDGQLRYAVASDSLTSDLEAIQLELGEGPCMLAHKAGEPVFVSDLAAEERFPAMVPRTLDRGMQAVSTLPLLRNGQSIGIVDLYRDARDRSLPGKPPQPPWWPTW